MASHERSLEARAVEAPVSSLKEFLSETKLERRNPMDSSEARTCSECGEPISAARLKELPFTRLCVGCKARQENEPEEPYLREKSEYLSAERDRKARASALARKRRWDSKLL